MPNDVPDGRPGRRGRGRPLLLAGTALAAVTVGAGVALAATSGPSGFPPPSAGLPRAFSAATSAPAASTTAPRFTGPGCLRVVTPRRAGLLCRRPGLPGVLHGTVVLPKPGGGTVTVAIQNGRVTSVRRSSITLRSEDGYTRTYAVTDSTIVDARPDGIGSVKTGDQVWVTATASGGTVTAIRVRDLSQLWAGPGHLPGHSNQPGGSAASFSGGSAGG
jgi:hypothetical protein